MPSASVATPALANRRSPVQDVFERLLADASPSHPHAPLVAPDVRRAAFENFQHLAAPGGRPGRDWKHDYARVAAELPAHDDASASSAPRDRILTSDAFGMEVTTGGCTLASTPDAARVRVAALDAAASEATRALFAERFGTAVDWRADKFASLAVALQREALALVVPAGVRVQRPILVSHGGTSAAAFPYVLVVLEPGAKATIVEDAGGACAFTSAIVEVFLEDGAELDYVVLQHADPLATVLASRGAVCARRATCRWHLAELGAGLSRSILSTRLQGKGAAAEVGAFFFNSADQHTDLATTVDHASGDTTSRTTIKSAANGRGQGRYLGNIRIAAHANGSDATLRDDALLLSKDAHIDSIPALEIASNDVKAFHGATVGSIAEDELFYAESRGIERSAAERMIALGFFEPLIAGFPIDALRDVLRDALAAKAGGRAGEKRA